MKARRGQAELSWMRNPSRIFSVRYLNPQSSFELILLGIFGHYPRANEGLGPAILI
jgi:hypothetical protein